MTLAAALLVVTDTRPSGGVPGSPNVVVILTDDQRWDTLWAMPHVRSELAAHGVTFAEAFAVNPWCCPSRANILTGQHSHTNGVYRNTPPDGGFASFKDGSTVATWLRSAGYRTALVGKYLNGYEGRSYIPPGWSHWVAFRAKTYGFYNYKLNVDGVVRSYGKTAKNYSTDVLRDYATSFIRSTPATEPLFLFFTPNAPHGTATGGYFAGPPKAAPRHSKAFRALPLWRPPSWNEADVSDKPAHIQAFPSINRDKSRKLQYQSLLAVDEAVKAIVDALRETGRLGNTMVVFASDNGYLWGEHRWGAKQVPYEESIRIPLVIRYDAGGAGGRTDSRMVASIDLAPTIADVAGVAAPGVEGRSLMPLTSGAGGAWRNELLIEHLQGPAKSDPIPTYCALRTQHHLYAVYATGERELYDLSTDPYQLSNRVDDPAHAGWGAELEIRLEQLCNPRPPGLTFSDDPVPD